MITYHLETNQVNKLRKKGVNSLSQAELLAIIVEKGNKLDESSVNLANKLLKRYSFLKLSR